MQCFEVLKFSQLEKDSMFEILAAILHLGNMEYTQTEQVIFPIINTGNIDQI